MEGWQKMDHTGPKMAKTHCHPVWLPCENVVWDSHCKITAQKLMKESKRANSLRPKYSQIISLLRPFTQLSIPYQSVRFLLKTGVSSRGGSLPKGGCAGIDQRHQLAVGDFHGLPTPSRKAAISCQALNSDSTQLRPPQVLARRNFLGFTPGSTQCSCHLQFRHRLHCLKSQIPLCMHSGLLSSSRHPSIGCWYPEPTWVEPVPAWLECLQ